MLVTHQKLIKLLPMSFDRITMRDWKKWIFLTKWIDSDFLTIRFLFEKE